MTIVLRRATEKLFFLSIDITTIIRSSRSILCIPTARELHLAVPSEASFISVDIWKSLITGLCYQARIFQGTSEVLRKFEVGICCPQFNSNLFPGYFKKYITVLYFYYIPSQVTFL